MSVEKKVVFGSSRAVDDYAAKMIEKLKQRAQLKIIESKLHLMNEDELDKFIVSVLKEKSKRLDAIQKQFDEKKAVSNLAHIGSIFSAMGNVQLGVENITGFKYPLTLGKYKRQIIYPRPARICIDGLKYMYGLVNGKMITGYQWLNLVFHYTMKFPDQRYVVKVMISEDGTGGGVEIYAKSKPTELIIGRDIIGWAFYGWEAKNLIRLFEIFCSLVPEEVTITELYKILWKIFNEL